MATIRSFRSKGRRGRAFKPSKAAALVTDGVPVLTGGYIEKFDERPVLVTTDRHLCLRLPIASSSNGEEIAEGYVPRAALLHIERDRENFEAHEDSLVIGRSLSQQIDGGGWEKGKPLVSYSRIEPGKRDLDGRDFPRIADAWPNPAKRPARISLDTKLLRRLAMALATDMVTIEIDLDALQGVSPSIYSQPLVISKYGNEDSESPGPDGVLMPLRPVR